MDKPTCHWNDWYRSSYYRPIYLETNPLERTYARISRVLVPYLYFSNYHYYGRACLINRSRNITASIYAKCSRVYSIKIWSYASTRSDCHWDYVADYWTLI